MLNDPGGVVMVERTSTGMIEHLRAFLVVGNVLDVGLVSYDGLCRAVGQTRNDVFNVPDDFVGFVKHRIVAHVDVGAIEIRLVQNGIDVTLKRTAVSAFNRLGILEQRLLGRVSAFAHLVAAVVDPFQRLDVLHRHRRGDAASLLSGGALQIRLLDGLLRTVGHGHGDRPVGEGVGILLELARDVIGKVLSLMPNGGHVGFRPERPGRHHHDGSRDERADCLAHRAQNGEAVGTSWCCDFCLMHILGIEDE